MPLEVCASFMRPCCHIDVSGGLGQAKKPRLSKAITEDDEVGDSDEDVKSSFSQRLTRFKKSPAKKGVSCTYAVCFALLIYLCSQGTL